MPEAAAWAIFLLPMASFLLISFVIRPFLSQYSRAAGYLAMAAVAGGLSAVSPPSHAGVDPELVCPRSTTTETVAEPGRLVTKFDLTVFRCANLRIHVGNDTRYPHHRLELAEREAIMASTPATPTSGRYGRRSRMW